MRTIHRAIIALLAAVLMSTLVIATTSTSASAMSTHNSSKVIKKAQSLKGIPYKWGGTSTKGFDCSGYTQYVFNKVMHKNIGRVVGDQAKKGHAVKKSSAKPGDLIIFGNYHVGIYAGGGNIWHASRPGKPVKKEKIWTRGYTVRRL